MRKTITTICIMGLICGIVGILIYSANNRYCEKINITYTVKEIIFHEQSTEIIYNMHIYSPTQKIATRETIGIIPFNSEIEGKRKIIDNTQLFLCKEDSYGEKCNIVNINRSHRNDVWDFIEKNLSTDNCKEFFQNLEYLLGFVYISAVLIFIIHFDPK